MTAFFPRPRSPRRSLSLFRPPISRRSLLPPTPPHSRRIWPRSFSTSRRSPRKASTAPAKPSPSSRAATSTAPTSLPFAPPSSCPLPRCSLLNGPDPGLADDQAEATLAASWAGAAAPGAQILLCPQPPPSPPTAWTFARRPHRPGSRQRDCRWLLVLRSRAEPAHQAFYSALYQQAAAEGITVIAATGDSGAAACTPAGGTCRSTPAWRERARLHTMEHRGGRGRLRRGGAAAGTSALTAWSPVNAADPAYASGGGSSALYARKSGSRFRPSLQLAALRQTIAFCPISPCPPRSIPAQIPAWPFA